MRYVLGFIYVLALAAMGCSETTGTGGSGGEGGDGGTTQQEFPCTEQGIRDAIAQGGGPHTFSCNGPQTVVTEAEIAVVNDIILDGEGNLTIDGNHDHRVFSVTTGVTAELRGMTVTRGSAKDAGPVDGNRLFGEFPIHRYFSAHTFGGGIVSVGTLALKDTTVVSSRADAGGGIYSEGTLMLTGSAVSENWAEFGAGIVNGGSGTLTLAKSAVSGNHTTGNVAGAGAGIYNEGQAIISNSTISENRGYHAWGGGIYNAGPGALSLINSTVSRNYSDVDGPGYGGGIYNGGEITIINSTVSDNKVAGYLGGFGGGIYSSGWMALINATVASNTAQDSASAIYVGSAPDRDAYLEVARTLVHGDCDKDTEGGSNMSWVSFGYNIESPGAGGTGGSGTGDTCGFDTDKGDQVNVSADDLKLGELADNGGPTMTHALGAGSVAIDQIPAEDCVDADGEPLTSDQRGEPRPETGGTMCDVGAFEVQP